MPCARKRLHERCVVQIDEIAYRLGYLCKRVLAFDLVNQCGRKRRSRSPDPPPAAAPDLIRGKNATYWSEAATSLSTEAAQLREEIQKRNREYQSILECNARLLTSYREMERRLLDADRELNYLRTDPFQESPVYSSIISTIPLNTEGRDALYWHQTCRTVMLQYQEAKREVDEKTNQFVMLSKRIRELESLLQKAGSGKSLNAC